VAILENVNPGAVGQTASALTVMGGITATAAIAAGGIVTGSGGLVVGAGATLTLVTVYTPTLTPAACAASIGFQQQTFTVTGLTTADKIFVNGPAPAALAAMVAARVSAADTLALTFANLSAAANVPAAGVYTVLAIRS